MTEEIETLYWTRRYIMALGPDSYLLLDRQSMEEPLATFPLTDEGFDAAESRFFELKRLDRLERVIPKTVAVITLIGVALWILGGLAISILLGTFGIDVGPNIAGITYVLDAFGGRIAIGGLIALGVVFLLRWQLRAAGDGRVAQDLQAAFAERSERNLWDTVASWALATGLILWIILAVATQALYRFEPAFFLPGGRPNLPSGIEIGAQVAETLAFRIWVAAFIFKLVRWSRRPLQKATTSQPP